MFQQVRVLVLLAVCAAGCAQPYADLIGDWEMELTPPRRVGLSVVRFSFRADSTFTAEFQDAQLAEPPEVSGTYRVEGDRVHRTSPDKTTSMTFEFRGKDILVLRLDTDVMDVFVLTRK